MSIFSFVWRHLFSTWPKRWTARTRRWGAVLGCAALGSGLSFVALAVPDVASQAHQPGRYDRLTLLLPDGADPNSWQVKVWTEAAAEEGIQIRALYDADFLAMGDSSASRIGGLVLPDSAHVKASHALVNAVARYVHNGGRLMLTYDAAALTEAGFYDLSGKSRFSDLVGVDYLLYDSLRERMVGFGPVLGTKGRLDNLEVPPGKYMPDVQARTLRSTAPTAAFVPANRMDPGGLGYLRPYMASRMRVASERRPGAAPVAPGVLLRYEQPVAAASAALSQSLREPANHVAATRTADDLAAAAQVAPTTSDSFDELSWVESGGTAAALRPALADQGLQAISGYVYGALSYPTFVTTGTFPGTAYLASAEHGLVAGVRSVGAGKVLFVNLPLGYLKAVGSDGMLLQGFLTHFARDQVQMPRVSVQPKGKGGLVYNWHVDDGDDIVPDLREILSKGFIRRSGPFSIHFTAGPDTVTLGDGQGMNLPFNPAAQDMVRRAGRLGWYASAPWVGNVLGSHGGWNHNLYGANANENNAAIYQPWLEMNFAAIENVTGYPLREYSAPTGNNPRWSTQWLEQHGVVAMYTVSNTGTAVTREWRDGQRVSSKVWAVPVTPFGKSAAFEEFDETGVTDAQTVQWLTDLQSFVVNHRTNRMFYSHPPGILQHLGVVRTLLSRARKLADANRFQWFSMAELADFSERRIKTSWASTSSAGKSTFVVYNPAGLADVTWLLPRTRYDRPVVESGAAQVEADSTHWLVKAHSGVGLKFAARERMP